MIDVVESKKESPDLELQRRLRKDLQLEHSPVLDKGLRVFAAVIKFHLFFVGAWMFGSAISPAFGRFLGWMVSPFASIAFWLHPQYDVQRHFEGKMGFEFYRNIVGETFFVGFFLGLLFAVSYFGRYIRKPWRFSQYCLEQWRTKASWIGALVLLIFAAPLSFAIGFWIAATYGFMATSLYTTLERAYFT